jgi:SsrA-binding protein
MNESAPVSVNRQARFDYFILDRLEAGIALQGTEVKAIREGKMNLKDSYVRIAGKEAYLVNCHISPYSKTQGHVDLDPRRTRKLLLNKIEIFKLAGKGIQKGYTVVPLSAYFKNGRVKIEIALARGKKQADRRETIKRRMHDRESQAAIKHFTRRKN